MLKRFKKWTIYFLCTVLLVFNILAKPLEVKATGAVVAPAAGVAVEAAGYILMGLLAAGLISAGAYELYENSETFSLIVDDLIGSINSGTVESPWRHWGDETIIDEKGDTQVRDPNTGLWERIPSENNPPFTEVEIPEVADKLGVPVGTVVPTGDYEKARDEVVKDIWIKSGHELPDESGGGGGQEPEGPEGGGDQKPEGGGDQKPDVPGGGGDLKPDVPGGGSSGDKNPFFNIFEYLKSGEGIDVAIGGGAIASVSSYLNRLFNGETEVEPVNSWLENLNYSYSGELEKIGDSYVVNAHSTYGPGEDHYLTGTSSERFCGVFSPSVNTITKDVYNGVTVWNITETGLIVLRDYTHVAKYNGGSRTTRQGSITGFNMMPECNFPIFLADNSDNAAWKEYLRGNADDSACINGKRFFTWPDIKDLSSRLPSTLAPFSSLPKGKALNTKALENYIRDMIKYKETAAPEDLANPDTFAQVAIQTANKNIAENTVDVKDRPEEEEKPSFIPPDTPTVGIEGLNAERDWRLVFPFCIPFDIVDLFSMLIAEPEAPRWEIPFNFPSYGIEYTFVIDMEQFESVAKVLRTCETVLYILGLAILTGKVIKW